MCHMFDKTPALALTPACVAVPLLSIAKIHSCTWIQSKTALFPADLEQISLSRTENAEE